MKRKLLKIALGVILLAVIGIPGIDLILAQWKTKQIVKALQGADHYTLKLDSIDEYSISALLRVEDPGFYTHKGLDFKSPGAGWTTISQGLVKLFYFKSFQPGLSKIRLMLITRFVFDPSVSKHTQLELFYNYAYLGNDPNGVVISGFSKASAYYFEKEFKDLTNNEYLSLVSILINPNKYRIDRYPEKNRDRVERIKKLLSGECQPNGWKDCEYEGCRSS